MHLIGAPRFKVTQGMERGKPQIKMNKKKIKIALHRIFQNQLKHKEFLTRNFLDTKLLKTHLFPQEQCNKIIIKLTIWITTLETET